MNDEPGSTDQPIDLTRTRLWWAIFLSFWTLLMVLFALQLRIGSSFRGEPRPWGDAFTIGAVDSYTWGILALVAFWLARRHPLGETGWARLAGVHLAAAVVLVVARLSLFYVLSVLTLIPSSQALGYWGRIIVAFPTNLLAYLLMVGVGYTLEFFRRARERELAESQLEARVANARLQLLNTQLQPRFLFTALRSISSLIHRDVEAADRTLALLGDLLRTTLQKGGREIVTLRAEIEFLELYLAIEQARSGAELNVEWKVRAEVLDLPVPHLVLQPLVENAVRGAVACKRIRVVAEARGAYLALEVWDSCGRDRPHPADARQAEAGSECGGEYAGAEAALAYAEARLAQIYGGAHRFHVGAAPGGGTIARIELPLGAELPGDPAMEDEPLGVPAGVGS